MLFSTETQNHERNAGVVLIAWVLIAYGVASATYAVLIAAGKISLSSGAWLIGGGMETSGPIVFLVAAFVYVACGLGLLRQKRWGLRLSYAVLLFGLVQVTPAISSAVADGRVFAIAREGLQILWRSAALWYLWQEHVKSGFE